MNGEPALSLQPMVHVEQVAPTVAFYEALDGTVLHGSREGDSVLLRIGAGELGLRALPPNPAQDEGAVELDFLTTEALAELESRCGRPESRSSARRPTPGSAGS